MPILTHYAGSSNQVLEFMSAAVIARILNRTLCLPPFFTGPIKHFGPKGGDQRAGGYGFEVRERYDVERLARFVRVRDLPSCIEECDGELDSYWTFHGGNRWFKHWNHEQYNETLKLDWAFMGWSKPDDVRAALTGQPGRCTGLGAIFPGLRWRGAYVALAPYLHPAPPIERAAVALQELAFGRGKKYLAVHWRFEETICKGLTLGLCFYRCNNGANQADPLTPPRAPQWAAHKRHGCPKGSRHAGVIAAEEDMIAAMADAALEGGVRAIYIATDGHIRGEGGCAILATVIKGLRALGLAVAGLWVCPGLPAFPGGDAPDSEQIGRFMATNITGFRPRFQVISIVEQEVAARAATFLGTGSSSWSLSVWRLRLGRQRAEALAREVTGGVTEGDVSGWDDLALLGEGGVELEAIVVDKLMEDNHMAGLECADSTFAHRYGHNRWNTTLEPGRDGWLDVAACEGRIGKGGSCRIAMCW